MRSLAERSIAFRIWLALSIIATVFTVLVLAIYVWLGVRDTVATAHEETLSKLGVVLAASARFGFDSSAANDGYSSIGGNLGVEFVQATDAGGRQLRTLAFNEMGLQDQPIDPQMLALADKGESTRRTVSIDGGSFKQASTSPLRVILGGHFGEEHVIPVSIDEPGQNGALRVLFAYPDVSGQARTLLTRSLLGGGIIIGMTVLGIWLFLKHSVSQPLHRYSRLATLIAQGEPVRMPADGRDELSELGRAINGMADALEYQATVDSLTGLYNLRHLSSTLEGLLAKAARTSTPLAVIVGDLDNLKPINDTYGHQAGDKLLKTVADAFLAWAGEEYVCWRLGGDEFVVALPNTDEDEALVKADNLRRAIGSTPVRLDGAEIKPAISVGVASFPRDGYSAGALLGAADRAMYDAKAMRAAERSLAQTPAA